MKSPAEIKYTCVSFYLSIYLGSLHYEIIGNNFIAECPSCILRFLRISGRVVRSGRIVHTLLLSLYKNFQFSVHLKRQGKICSSNTR